MILEELTATPIDIAVCWAVEPDDEAGWRTSGLDRFLRWRPEHGCWCRAGTRGLLTRTWEPFAKAVEHHGRLLAFHPQGLALVMEETTRMLVVLPAGALRVRETE